MPPRIKTLTIRCRLCKQDYLAITASHLIYRHGFTQSHPVKLYKKLYRLRTVESDVTREKHRFASIAYFYSLGRHWTRERVIKAIKQRHADRRSLAISRTLSEEPQLVHAGKRLYGSWRKALVAVGFDPLKARLIREKWTPGEVLTQLRRDYQAGKLRYGSRYWEQNFNVTNAAVRIFGSCGAALKRAGIPALRSPNTKWTKREVISRIHQRAKRGLPLGSRDVQQTEAGLFAARRLFNKSWNELIQELGYRGRRLRWTKEQILAEIRRLRRSGRDPNYLMLRQTFSSLTSAAARHFGSWRATLKAAGLTPNRVRKSEERGTVPFFPASRTT